MTLAKRGDFVYSKAERAKSRSAFSKTVQTLYLFFPKQDFFWGLGQPDEFHFVCLKRKGLEGHWQKIKTQPWLSKPHEPGSQVGKKSTQTVCSGFLHLTLSIFFGASSDGKLVDKLSHEQDVTSLQDHSTSCLSKTPFYFTIVFNVKRRRGILFQIHGEYSPSSRLLVSALAVYATAFRPMFLFQVGLGICRTDVDSQWNTVYKAFHQIRCCENDTIRQ